MMKTISSRCLVGAALVSLLSACGAGSVASGESGTESEVVVKVNELATVSVGDAQITFLQTEGESDISIEEQASIYAKQTPMQQLSGHALTSLELFLSLAPDEVPPEALIAAHAGEAEALGRDNDDIVPVELDVASTLQKSVTPSQCDVMWERPYNSNYQPWVNKTRMDNLTTTQTLCGGMGCYMGYQYPDQVILMGICNSSSRWLPYVLKDKSLYSDTWRLTGRYARPNSINAHWHTNRTPYNHAIEGRPQSGSGITYHLRAAIGNHI